MKTFSITKHVIFVSAVLLSSYISSFALSGTYTVGAGGNYSTLAAAVSDLVGSGVTGPVTFNILNGTYSSTHVSINAVPGASAANRITFRSASGNAANVIISYAGSSSSNNYIFKLNGASYITLKDLTLNNTGSTYGTAVLLTGASSYDSVVSCVLKGSTSNSTSTNKSRVYANPLTGSNLVVAGCSIERGSYGIYIRGTSTSLTSNNHTFSNNTFTNNYYGFVYGYYLGNTTVRGNTCSATSVGTHYGIYFNYQQNGMIVENNTITTTGSGTHYGVSNYYYGNYYSGSTTTPLRIANNNISVTSTGSTYGVYMYYRCYYVEIEGNTILSKSTSSGSTYGVYVYYYPIHCSVINNIITTEGKNGTGYPFYVYYTPTSTSHFTCTGNTVTGSTTTGTLYGWYTYYHYNAYYENNTVHGSTTSGTIYGYGPMYYNYNSRATNNNITYTKTSSGSVYNYGINYYGSADTFDHNTVTITTANSTINNYLAYYGTGKVLQNTFTTTSTSGSVYNYLYRANAALIDSNTINATTTTGTNYGIYAYYSTASSIFSRNTCNIKSNSGTVYGIYAYYNYSSAHKFINNAVCTKTSGSNYTLQSYYSSPEFYNNTFHSNATGYTNYAGYIYNTSSTYSPKMMNNVFSRTGANGYLMYVYNSGNMASDYNLYHTQGSSYFQRVSPSLNASTLTAWRTATGKDRNSIIYSPGFMDAANGDLRPDPANPVSWSVQGRGVHIPGDTLDIQGNDRAKTPVNGVPDLGAYEFTPTSTPPDAVATPANANPNSEQVFTFGEDTVGFIAWGSVVPAMVAMKQYTGVQAGPIPAGVGRMYFYTTLSTSSYEYEHKPVIRYKNPWIGDVSSEGNARIAKSSNGGTWAGYNYSRGITDTINNNATTSVECDSLGDYTIVENGRIGIRCVQVPQGLTHSNITALSADEAWEPVFNPIGYEYVVDESDGTPSATTAVKFSSTNAASLSGLKEDTKYYVHVRSICGAKDTSGWAIDSFVTLITCHSPDLKITSLDARQAVVYWDSVKTAVKFEYEISESATPPSYGTPTKNYSVLATYLKSGTTYYAHVRSFCNSIYNESAWATMSFTTKFSTGVDGVNADGLSLFVYPNPVKDVLIVDVKGKQDYNPRLIISDITGKVVRKIEVHDARIVVNTEDLPAGVYIVKYSDESSTKILKVSKQ